MRAGKGVSMPMVTRQVRAPEFSARLTDTIKAHPELTIEAFENYPTLGGDTSEDDPTSVNDVVSRADVVVSHAGPKSVLAALRWCKPLVVVENSVLADANQRAMIAELGETGQGYFVEGNLGMLGDAVGRVLVGTKAAFRGITTASELDEDMAVMREG